MDEDIRPYTVSYEEHPTPYLRYRRHTAGAGMVSLRIEQLWWVDSGTRREWREIPIVEDGT